MFLTIETLHSRHFKPKDIFIVQYFFPYQRTPIGTLWPFRSTLQGKQTWLPFRHGSISCQVPLFNSPCGMWSCKRPCTWEDIHKHDFNMNSWTTACRLSLSNTLCSSWLPPLSWKLFAVVLEFLYKNDKAWWHPCDIGNTSFLPWNHFSPFSTYVISIPSSISV